MLFRAITVHLQRKIHTARVTAWCSPCHQVRTEEWLFVWEWLSNLRGPCYGVGRRSSRRSPIPLLFLLPPPLHGRFVREDSLTLYHRFPGTAPSPAPKPGGSESPKPLYPGSFEARPPPMRSPAMRSPRAPPKIDVKPVNARRVLARPSSYAHTADSRQRCARYSTLKRNARTQVNRIIQTPPEPEEKVDTAAKRIVSTVALSASIPLYSQELRGCSDHVRRRFCLHRSTPRASPCP